jgi:hypothetical protein
MEVFTRKGLPARQKKWCLLAELNCGHVDFQSTALPTELKRQGLQIYVTLRPISRRKVLNFDAIRKDFFFEPPVLPLHRPSRYSLRNPVGKWRVSSAFSWSIPDDPYASRFKLQVAFRRDRRFRRRFASPLTLDFVCVLFRLPTTDYRPSSATF